MESFLDMIKDKCLCVSLLFNETERIWKPQEINHEEEPVVATDFNASPKDKIQSEIKALKDSLKIDEAGINQVEMQTREQRTSDT